LFGILMGDKCRVVIQGKLSLSAKAIEDRQQAGMFSVDTLACKLDDRV